MSSFQGEEELDLREENRSKVLKRSRQWATVGDSDDEDGQPPAVTATASSDTTAAVAGSSDDSSASSDDSDSSDDSSDSGHKRRRKESKGGEDSDEDPHKKKDKKKKEDKKKHEKKSKKSKKEKKEKKSKKEKKEKKSKKEKSHKDKDRDRDREKKPPSLSAVNQNVFGMYGIIREDSYFQKQREFEAYMAEVKHMPGIAGGSKREVMQWFKAYIEDYNTATMPHEKYYNLESWEMKEYRLKQQKDYQQRLTGAPRDVFNDEEERRLESKRLKEKAEEKEFAEIKQRMAADTSKRADIRRQEQLKIQMQLAHKQGDQATVQRLERLLAPDEVKVTTKHPWA